MNKLFYGDNLGVLRELVRTETIDLCVITSKRNYNQIYNNVW